MVDDDVMLGVWFVRRVDGLTDEFVRDGQAHGSPSLSGSTSMSGAGASPTSDGWCATRPGRRRVGRSVMRAMVIYGPRAYG
jgi:hypothetical protein